MKHLKASLALATAVIISCGGGGGDNPSTTSGSGITGILYAPDGSTPIAGATVYIPGQGTTAGLITQALECEPPTEDYVAYTCTEADGSFSLPIDGLSGTITVKFEKGAFKGEVVVDLNSGDTYIGNVTLPSDPQQGAPKMAVVTGTYDRMEDVLAKLGFGQVNSNGELILGTETFDLYDGNGSLNDTYHDFPALFADNDGNGQADIFNYDIVFINCGNNYEDLLNDQNIVSTLRQYVRNGGRLYITDLSYDFVEQVFPEYIDFYGSDNTPENEPEEMQAAQVGKGGITTQADVLDNTLKNWLATVSCSDADGNSVPCISQDGKVHIEGFLGAWAVINGAHASAQTNVKIWVRGEVSWLNYSWEDFIGGGLIDGGGNFSGSEESGVKPLTITFQYGEGKVLYTSYHTESANITGLLPQERILQYLVFF